MNPEEKLHRDIWDALDELKQESLITPQDEWTLLERNTTNRERAIKALVNFNAIKIVKSKYPSVFSAIRAMQTIQGIEETPIGYYLEILEPKFTEVLNFYYDKIGKNVDSNHIDPKDIEILTEKLKEWQNINTKNISTDKNNSTNNKNLETKKIEKLAIVEPKKSSPLIQTIINDRYNDPISFDKNKATGAFLLKFSNSIKSENKQKAEPLRTNDYKSSIDFLNSDQNLFVKKLKVAKTKIFASRSGYVDPTIEIEAISQKAYKQRINQHKNP